MKDNDEKPSLVYGSTAHRVLTLIYDMSDGKAGVPIEQANLTRRAHELGLFYMSPREFETYCEGVRSRAANQS